MANRTATFATTISYVDESGADKTKSASVDVTYQSLMRGELDVPAGTTSTTVFTVPMGSLAAVSGLWLKNGTLQDMTLTVNATAMIDIPAGGQVSVMGADLSGDPITAVTLTATTTETLAAKIQFLAFGDPT